MKYLIFLIAFLLNSCSTEEELEVFEIYFQNDSSETVDIRFYNGNTQDTLDFSNQIDFFQIQPAEKKFVCEYYRPSFTGFSCDSVGIMTFEFPNEEGHYCYSLPNNGRCFNYANKNVFFNSDKYVKNGNEYTFHITQDDYENAYELP